MQLLRRSLARALPGAVKSQIKRSGVTLLESTYRLRVRAIRSGVNRRPRPTPLVVSLTTTAGRLFHKADIAIATLLTQRFKPDRIVLWVPEELRDRGLPEGLRPLIANGLEVRYRPDVGPHSKLVHALREFPGSIIVTADDDLFYPSDWLSSLHASYERAPEFIHCHRAHLMRTDAEGGLRGYYEWDLYSPGYIGPSHLLFPTGTAGVLYPPGSLADEVLDVEAFRRLCPTNDDIWFKAMALLKGTAAQKVAPRSREYRLIPGSQESQLMATNLETNDVQLRATFAAYDLYRLL